MNIGSAIQNLTQLTQQIQALAQQLQGMKPPAGGAGGAGGMAQQARPQVQQQPRTQPQAQPFRRDTFDQGPARTGGAGGATQPQQPTRAGGAQGAQPSMTPTGQSFTAKGTGYFPDNSPMEGGFKDRMGKPLHTLQDFLNGKAPYVSVAMDSKAFPYGTKLRIPELEKKYGRPIEFRVVDTGGAFKGKGTSRIDICTANRKASLDPTVNGKLTLVPQK
jgi:3D (Asp-Asp-Asp) domain-containing protein